jgi:hypothetical protein
MPPGLPPPKKTNAPATEAAAEPLVEQPETETPEPTDEGNGEAED